MTLLELAAEFRRQVGDVALPYLWSDDEVFQYIVEAQDEFVRLTGGIADVTVASGDEGNPVDRLNDLVLTEDEPYTAFSPYILRVRSARLLTAQRDIEVAQEADLRTYLVRDFGWSTGLQLDDEDTGEVTHGMLGVRDKYVRWVRVPDTADTCRMHVMRLPLPRLTGLEDADPQLVVDARHHRGLLLWMKHLAYSKQDAEARDDKRADESRVAFELYAERSRRELERQRYRPRSVQYSDV